MPYNEGLRKDGEDMAFETILFEKTDGVAVITLNRPDKLNAFTTQMHGELKAALDDLKQDDAVRVLVLTGAGRAFCAGQDLSDRAVGPGDEPRDLGASIDTLYNPLVRTLRALELPVISAVNGVAAGAGANVALAADIVLAARSANFIQAFCKLGLVPDSGGTYTLPRLVGRARAMGLTMLGDKLPAKRAEAIGLIWKAVDDDDLMAEAMALAKHLATQPTKGLAMIKQAINASLGNDLDTQLDLERDLQRIAGRTADYQEGVNAFLEKRTPKFTGK